MNQLLIAEQLIPLTRQPPIEAVATDELPVRCVRLEQPPRRPALSQHPTPPTYQTVGFILPGRPTAPVAPFPAALLGYL